MSDNEIQKFKPDPAPEPASLESIIVSNPRGGGVDKDAADALAKLDGPALPGTAEANKLEAYRQRLIAGNRAQDGRTVNSAVEGTLVGLGVAAVGVVAGLEAALVVGVGVGVWKLVSFLRGRQP